MTLDEAICHAEDVAEENEKRASWFWGKEGNPNYENCIKCAEEHRQLAEWLRDYKRLKEQEPICPSAGIDCEDCPAYEPSGDLISREKVCDYIAEFINHEYSTDAECEMVDLMIKGIQHMPSVKPQEPKWIPVSERLPKAGEYIGDVAKYYLVQNEYGDMLVARYTHGEYWEQIYQLKPIGDEIVAWMPLPKPYEPQESEE